MQADASLINIEKRSQPYNLPIHNPLAKRIIATLALRIRGTHQSARCLTAGASPEDERRRGEDDGRLGGASPKGERAPNKDESVVDAAVRRSV